MVLGCPWNWFIRTFGATGLEMEVDGAGDWLVPSGSEPSLLHRVSLIEDTCTCDDHRYTGHRCKHR